MVRKVGYWLGVAAVTSAAAWLVWLSWHTVPARDAESLADRFRVLVLVLALAVLPWLGRSRGVFGPVGDSVAARFVRVAACAALCGVGFTLLRLDSHARGNGIGSAQFSWPRQIGGLALLVLLIAAPFVVYARWPRVEASTLWCLIGVAGVIVAAFLPLQTLTALYVAGILFATSEQSPLTPVTLAVSADAGLAAAASTHVLTALVGGPGLFKLLVIAAVMFTLAMVAAMAAAWLDVSRGTPHYRRAVRIRQGVLAGLASGIACGLLAPLFGALLLIMLVMGPLAGVAGGALGAAIAADHPRTRVPVLPVGRGPFAAKS
jgi:hypothetical protein